VEILPGRREKLDEYVKKGYRLFGMSNQSGVAKGLVSARNADSCFKRTNELLGHNIKYTFCPHNVPPTCYCRKPQVGLFVWLYELCKLNPAQCIFVGDQTTDKTVAQRCKMQYYHPDEFFK